MAAAHWKPKSLDLALPIFLLLLILLPEARYNQHTVFEIYFFPSPLSSFHSSPPDSCFYPADVFCITPVLIRFTAAEDMVILATPLEAKLA